MNHCFHFIGWKSNAPGSSFQAASQEHVSLACLHRWVDVIIADMVIPAFRVRVGVCWRNARSTTIMLLGTGTLRDIHGGKNMMRLEEMAALTFG
jgi:hypothetical protein